MTASRIGSIILYTWVTLGIFWLFGMAFTKRTARSQSTGARALHLIIVLPGYLLLIDTRLAIDWLGARFVPAAPAIAIAGLAITIAGCLFAAWARLTLGANWSGRVELKQNHQLITNGPYALARHPIYTGLILAAAGTAVAIGEWQCIIGLVLVIFAFVTKIHQEEPIMLQAFPDAYPEYRKRVKALLPGIF
jgi:protein-S-isoprenylcysteine O-methyltransferase Ste14